MISQASKESKRPMKKKKMVRKKIIGTCLVLMPFKEPFDTYYLSIIKPAVTAAKLHSVRGDSLFRPSPIMADIWQMIQDSEVLVADLTEKNANVFYELGLAHAIGKPVVLISDNLADVPFDLQSLRVIIYDKNDPSWGSELKTSIVESLGETLTDTASVVPSMFRKVVKSQAPTESKTNQRLDILEQQIATFAARNSGFSSRLRSPSDLYRRLKRAGSRSEAIDLARAALISGMPSDLVSRVVRDSIRSAREARAILVSLGLPKWRG